MASSPSNLLAKVRDALSVVNKEQSVLKKLHRSTRATLKQLESTHPELDARLKEAYGYAIFPIVGEAAVILGGAYGLGEVFSKGNLIGYAAVAQLTLGLQLGGDTFSELIVFHTKRPLDRFERGASAFSASADTALLKATARTANDYERDVSVITFSHGGALIQASIGVQKFIFKPAGAGRLKTSPAPRRVRAPKKRSRHATRPSAARGRSTSKTRSR